MDDELELIRRCRTGDRGAQLELFKRTSPRVYRLLLRLTGNADDAFDLTQDTFLKGFTRIGQFNGHSSVITWLHRIAVNEALQLQRRNQTERRKLDKLAAVTSLEHEENGGLTRGLDVEAALLTLPPPDRTLLLLRYKEGYDYRTIAEITGLAAGTIASRLNRARNHLRNTLREAYGTMEEDRGAVHPTDDGSIPLEADGLGPPQDLREKRA